MLLDNDVLSIISIYVDIPIYYNSSEKLIIKIDKKCGSCNSRMRRTHKSLIEVTYAFPNLWELDNAFNSETGKYIRIENTFIKNNNKIYTYNEAKDNGFISYNNNNNKWDKNQLYGGYIIHNVPVRILVKKAPSLTIFYKTLREVMGYYNNETAFLIELKKFEKEGINYDIMDEVIKKINIINYPKQIVVKLCSKCRKKLKKGYIFI